MSNIEAPNLLDQFSAALIKETVDIITFAESPKYLGKKLYPRQKTLLKIIFLQDLDDYDLKVIAEWEKGDGETTINPKLFERMKYLKDNGYSHFRTIQFVGGRRSGKGFITAIAVAYKTYLLTLLDSVGKHYGIDEGKAIYFNIVADSMEQAKNHQFSDAVSAILECSYLQQHRLISKVVAESIHVNTPFDIRRAATLRASGAKIDKDMASLIVKANGTNSKTLRGSASMMFVFDEFAHFISGESKMSDEEIFKAAVPSLATFDSDAMIFVNSSPYSKVGKFYELYEQSLLLDNEEPVFPTHLMIKFPSWETYKDWDKVPGISGPLISPPEDDPIMRAEERADPTSFKVEYRSNFAEVVDAFLIPEMVDRVFDPIFTEESIGRTLVPQYGATAYLHYSGHGDPATVQANFGLAVGHIEEIEGDNGPENHVVFDWIDAFYPEDFEDSTIDWLEVMPALTELINAFRPHEFTFDQYESAQTIQILADNLRKQNIDTSVYSIFATPKINEVRAKVFRTAINLGRVHAPHPSVMIGKEHNSLELVRNELKFLQEKGGRVDRQTVGPVQTKDIADCMMQVTNALIGDSINNMYGNLNGTLPAFGSTQGQYGLGNTSSFPELESLYRGAKKGYQGRDLARGMHRKKR